MAKARKKNKKCKSRKSILKNLKRIAHNEKLINKILNKS